MVDTDKDGIPDNKDKRPRVNDKTGETVKYTGVTNPDQFTPSGQYSSGTTVRVRDPRSPDGYRDLSPTDAKQWYQFFPQTFPNVWKATVDPLIRAGVVKDSKDAIKKLQDGVDWAAIGMGGDKANPFDYLQIAPAETGGDGQVTTQAVQYTPQSIKGVGNNVWMSELGREMTNKEAKAMAKLFNAESRKSPSVYTGTTQTVGMSPEVFLQEQARSQEGYAERQVGVRFMDILDKFISSPSDIEKIAMEG